MHSNDEVRNTFGMNTAEITELNFVGESQWAYMSTPPRSGAGGLERLPSLKHYNALKQNNTFTLELNTAKNTHYIKKCLKIKVVEH